ncbi:18222_t:CDS:1, partial [Acaulospora morrowiae]
MGEVLNATKRMAKKFHIGARHVYEIWEHNEHLQQDLDNWDDFPPSDSNNEACTKSVKNIKSRSKLIHNSDQSFISNGSIDKVNKILETISPEITQETEDPLELFKRTQKDAKKTRTI